MRQTLALVRRHLLGVVGAGLLLLSVGSVAAANRMNSWWNDLGCEADVGDSNYGESGWSWWPIGGTCEWTAERNGFARTETPDWAATAGVLGGAGVGVVFIGAHVIVVRRRP